MLTQQVQALCLWPFHRLSALIHNGSVTHNTRHTKTCDPPATCTKTYSLYKTYTTYGSSIMALALWFFHNPPPSQKLPALCPENVLPLAARPHSAMVVHQLHHTLPGVPSVCQMGHSVWAFWPNRCEFYRPKSVLKTAGALYVCACFFFLLTHLCLCMSF